MTKVRLMSDLHLEFGPLDLEPASEDVLVLAGDIGLHTQGLAWADEQAKSLGVPVVMIAGNHEFYQTGRRSGRSMASTIQALRRGAAATQGRVTYLENDSALVGGIRFIGSTLWTDFDLFDDPASAMALAAACMSDFRVIDAVEGVRFEPSHALSEHHAARAFLEKAIEPRSPVGPAFQPGCADVVIVTHHGPSARSVARRYARDALSAAFVSRLDDLVVRSGAALWVHGHVHDSFDYTLGRTRVRCNPRGYVDRLGNAENRDFAPDLVIEI